MPDVAPLAASIVIPAHNEESVIGRTLDALVAEGAEEYAVVVVANGCTDKTAEVARSYADRLPHLQVLETPAAGKTAALNAGDQAVSDFPRVYLDADIELVDGALRALVTDLSGDRDAVAAPSVHFDTDGASAVPRAFYQVYSRLPYVQRRLVGLGVYALSERGRARFGAFPDVMADDLFVQQQFSEQERLTSAGRFVVRAPRRTPELVRVRARGADGTRQLAKTGLSPHSLADERGSSLASLGRLGASRPWLLPQIVVYVAVTVAGRRLGARESGVWQRDESTRATASAAQRTRVAYLVSLYPKLSHTFIEREVLGLRALGVEVHTFSIRPSLAEVRDEVGQAEARATPVLVRTRLDALRRAGAVAGRHPGITARLLATALRTGQRRPRARLWQLFYAVEAMVLFSYLRRLDVRHIHVHLANNGADVARLAVDLGRMVHGPDAGWRWTLTMHGPTEFEAVDHFDLAAKVVSASGVACISDFTRSQLMRLVPAEQWPKLHVVRMGVDLDHYPFRPHSRPEGAACQVLFVGRLVAEKGVMVLLEAQAELASRGVRTVLRIVGEGEMGDQMARAVRRLGLEGSVELLGAKSQADVAREFARADVFCLPSFQEGLPVVLMEALATGVPVVTTRVNGIPELVEDRVSGRLVTPGRPDLVADALSELAGDPTARDHLAREGRRRVETEFASTVTARAQLAFLHGTGR